MSGSKRVVMSKKLTFKILRGGLADATKMANDICSQTPTVREVDFKKLVQGAYDQAAAQLKKGQGKWLLVIEEDVILEGSSNKSPHTHHQFKHFSNDDFDHLEREVNHFCERHEVTKLQVKWHDPAEGQWTVICRYAVVM